MSDDSSKQEPVVRCPKHDTGGGPCYCNSNEARFKEAEAEIVRLKNSISDALSSDYEAREQLTAEREKVRKMREQLDRQAATIAGMQARIEAADKQEPVLLVVVEENDGGTLSHRISWSEANQLPLGDWPMFVSSPIHSERELELLAVIEQMRNAHPDYAWIQNNIHLPDLSALKEHDAKVLEEVAAWSVANKLGILTCDDLRRMAEERRKPCPTP